MKKLLLGLFSLLLINACQENFDLEDDPTNQLTLDIESDLLTNNGTYISTAGNQFSKDQFLTGWDNLLPTLESAPKDNEKGPNSFCPFGQTMFLYKNGILVGSWDEFEGSHFTTTYDASFNRYNYSWQIPSNIPSGTGYQLGLGSFSECIPGSRLHLEPIGKKSRFFEIIGDRCEIEITMNQNTYETGGSIGWNWASLSDGPNKFVSVQFYENGILVGQFLNNNMLNFGHQLGSESINAASWINNPATTPGTYKLVYTMNCGSGRTASDEKVFSVVNGSGGGIAPPFIPEF